MSVKLAAQTLSASVARAMKNAPENKRTEMEETAKFVDVMDIGQVVRLPEHTTRIW